MSLGLSSLVVHLDADPRCDLRVRLAARLARAHGAHLLGIAPASMGELHSRAGAASRYLDEAEAARDASILHATRCAQAFEARCALEGAPSIEPSVLEGDPSAVLLHAAQCSDLTVIGQAAAASPTPREDRRFVEHVLMHNARPTLLVPSTEQLEAVGRDILVAWDGSRSAARTTADALPLLRGAARVRLRAWRRAGEPAEAAVLERLFSVQAWLTRQGVRCDAQVETARRAVGEAILDCAVDTGADLIVMGTYGHSRWTERLFGGATRAALEHSPVPLLMSH